MLEEKKMKERKEQVVSQFKKAPLFIQLKEWKIELRKHSLATTDQLAVDQF